MFFTLSTWQLALALLVINFGATFIGLWIGRRLSHRSDVLRDPLSIVHGALLTLVALILAFGLAMAVGRHDARRTAVVDDANAIGTTYLRAQTLQEPQRSESMDLLRQYTAASLDISTAIPGSTDQKRAIEAETAIQRDLWRLAGEAMAASPVDAPPRLYMESLNDMIDMQTTRVAALNNRVPYAIVLFQVVSAATALALTAIYLALMSRGKVAILLTAGVLPLLLFVSFDLDRPTRGFIEIPSTPLTALQDSMRDPAAYGP